MVMGHYIDNNKKHWTESNHLDTLIVESAITSGIKRGCEKLNYYKVITTPLKWRMWGRWVRMRDLWQIIRQFIKYFLVFIGSIDKIILTTWNKRESSTSFYLT